MPRDGLEDSIAALTARHEEAERAASRRETATAAALSELQSEVVRLREGAASTAATTEKLLAAQREAAVAHTEIGVLRTECGAMEEALREAGCRAAAAAVTQSETSAALAAMAERHSALARQVARLVEAGGEVRRVEHEALSAALDDAVEGLEARVDGAVASAAAASRVEIEARECAAAALSSRLDTLDAAQVRLQHSSRQQAQRLDECLALGDAARGTVRGVQAQVDELRGCLEGWGAAFVAASTPGAALASLQAAEAGLGVSPPELTEAHRENRAAPDEAGIGGELAGAGETAREAGSDPSSGREVAEAATPPRPAPRTMPRADSTACRPGPGAACSPSVAYALD